MQYTTQFSSEYICDFTFGSFNVALDSTHTLFKNMKSPSFSLET